MALDFPEAPAIGDSYMNEGRTWEWDGVAWILRSEKVVVLDDDTFVSATAEDPPSSESTKAYVDNKFASRAAATERFIVTPDRFMIHSGAPVRELAASHHSCWNFRTAQDDGVVATVGIGTPDGIPANWVTFSVGMLWCNAAATSGQVRFQTQVGAAAGWSVGDSLPAVTMSTAVITTSSGVQYRVEETPMGTVGMVGEDFMSLTAWRNGLTEVGGVANSILFLGMRLARVTG